MPVKTRCTQADDACLGAAVGVRCFFPAESADTTLDQPLGAACGDVPRQLAEGHFRLWARGVFWIILNEHAVEAVVASRGQEGKVS